MPIHVHRPSIDTPEFAVPDGEPLAFFAGPIMGAKNWQANAIRLTSELVPPDKTLHIADPRWPMIPETKRLSPDQQRGWEKAHYRSVVDLAAISKGVVAFWIAAESPDAPVPNRPGRAYGQGTRSEFSEVIGMMQMVPYEIPIVLGIDPKHSGQGLHEYRHTATEFDIEVHQSLGAVCRRAVAILLPDTNTGVY